MINGNYSAQNNTSFGKLQLPRLPKNETAILEKNLGALATITDVKVRIGSGSILDMFSDDFMDNLKISISPLKKTLGDKVSHVLGLTPSIKFSVFRENLDGNLRRHAMSIMGDFDKKHNEIAKAEPNLDKSVIDYCATQIVNEQNKDTVYFTTIPNVVAKFKT